MRRRNPWPATRRELVAFNAGRRLHRLFPDWELVEAALPRELEAALRETEREARTFLSHHVWWYYFFLGWDSFREDACRGPEG